MSKEGRAPAAREVTAQFLALNGWQADLGPPDAAAKGMVAELAAGTLGSASLADWLAPRLRPCDNTDTCAKEAPMQRWLPGRKRSVQPKDPFARFTDRARQVVFLAQEEARRLNHNHIGTEHLLLGLLREGEGVAAKALESLGISLEAVRVQVEEIIGQGQSAPTGHIPFTPSAKKALELSLRESLQLGHNYLGTEHLLLGVIREGEGVGAQVLAAVGADYARVREQVVRLLTGYSEQAAARTRLVRMTVPADLLDYEEKIAQVRRQREAAIEAGDFDRAAALRDREKQLLADKLRLEREWMAGVDVQAVVEENQWLHGEVERLRGLLRQRGIEPDDGNSQTA